MSAPRRSPTDRDEQGFALLVLLALVGVGAVGVVVALERLVPAAARTVAQTEERFDVVASAARFAYRSNGAFPANLGALATATGLDAGGSWRTDPWAPPADLNYRVVAASLTVRGRGEDNAFNTGDDMQRVVPTENLVRVRQRGRERLIRAALLRSTYCFAPTMTAPDLAAMRTAMRDHAIARRAWLTADATTRITLQATLTSSANTVTTLRTSYARPSIPNSLVGTNGLMARLGMPDTRCYDGLGRSFVRDAILGVRSAGADRTGGTDDDM